MASREIPGLSMDLKGRGIGLKGFLLLCISLIALALASCQSRPSLGETFTLKQYDTLTLKDADLTLEIDVIYHWHEEDGQGKVRARFFVTVDGQDETVSLEPGEEATVDGYRIALQRVLFIVGDSSCDLLVTRE